MSKTICFHSHLADHMEQFVAFKRMEGYDYTDQARNLSYFDRFLANEPDEEHSPCLKSDMLQRYVDTTIHLEVKSRRRRLSSLRQFSRYEHARYPHSEVLPLLDTGPPVARTIRFFRIESVQVAELIAATRIVLPSENIRADVLRMLIGLLYCTGLRIGEALKLTLGDIDELALTLHVKRGKFGKERLVPISPSTLEALHSYLVIRNAYASTSTLGALFVGACDKALTWRQAYDGFQRVCRYCKLNGPSLPRLHDLRHNYACGCLALWRQQGRDVNAMLPVLSTALGHSNIYCTQIYFHIELVELHEAAARLRTKLNTHRSN